MALKLTRAYLHIGSHNLLVQLLSLARSPHSPSSHFDHDAFEGGRKRAQ